MLCLSDISVDELLSIAAGIENRSEHPLANAIIRKAKSEAISIPPVSDFQAVPGKAPMVSLMNSVTILVIYAILTVLISMSGSIWNR